LKEELGFKRENLAAERSNEERTRRRGVEWELERATEDLFSHTKAAIDVIVRHRRRHPTVDEPAVVVDTAQQWPFCKCFLEFFLDFSQIHEM